MVLTQKKVDATQVIFTEETWEKILSCCKHGLNLTQVEFESLKESIVARFCAALPYAANCEDPDRLAMMLLSLLIVDWRGSSPFDARINDLDGSLRRIEPYFEPLFASGDTAVVRRGMLLLGCKTFAHWIETTDTDSTVLEGVAKYGTDLKEAQKALLRELREMPKNQILDGIISLKEAEENQWMRE